MKYYLEAANAVPKLPEAEARACTAGLVLALGRCKELERSIHLALELDDPPTTLKLAQMLEAQQLPQVTQPDSPWGWQPFLCMTLCPCAPFLPRNEPLASVGL